jgi:two-component system sensor histidine kinase BaeS
MDNRRFPLSALSLRAKLVLSYLAVIVGTVLVLSFVVSESVQAYYTNAQRAQLQSQANDWKQKLLSDTNYFPHNNPGNMPFTPRSLIAVANSQGNASCSQTLGDSDNCKNPLVSESLIQGLQGQSIAFEEIKLQTDGGSISGYYTSFPLESGGKIIGAMILAEPSMSPGADFLQQINDSILFAGLAVAGIAVLCCFLIVRRFMRPLETLTIAAERMKRGEYTQRVPLPKKLDELGLLGLTFNEMADTIAADINELRRQDQVRRDLVANIAHDLATPLTAIQGFSEALADNVITDTNQRHETAQRIGREVLRLRRLVADIQQMSSLEAGRVKLDLAPLDVHTLVDETLFVMEPECERQGITLRNEISPETPQVLADGDRITQVLLNLLENARRHTPADGQIRVGAVLQDNFVYMWVRDTGSGIAQADLPHIFERFYRADRSRTKATGGSGLGLSIVKAIIIAHGGKIWAESQPGWGTRITFRLPMVVEARPLGEAKSSEQPTAPSKWGRPKWRSMLQPVSSLAGQGDLKSEAKQKTGGMSRV